MINIMTVGTKYYKPTSFSPTKKKKKMKMTKKLLGKKNVYYSIIYTK